MKQLFSLFLLIVLFGCATRIYGLPEEVWYAMTPAERQQHMMQRQELSLSREAGAQTQAELELARLQQNSNQDKQQPVEESLLQTYLKVRLAGGTMLIANQRQTFEPIELLLVPETLQSVAVQAKEGLDYSVFDLIYTQGRLSIEPQLGAYHLTEQEQWREGRSYWLSTGVGHQWQQVGVQLQWLDMLPEEHQQWQQQQQGLWQQQRLERESLARIAAQAEARRLAAEAERLAAALEESAKREPQPVAPRISLQLNSGFAYFNNQLRPFRPLFATLEPGQSMRLPLVALTGETNLITLSWNGQQLSLAEGVHSIQFNPRFDANPSYTQRFDAPWVLGLQGVELVIQIQP